MVLPPDVITEAVGVNPAWREIRHIPGILEDLHTSALLPWGPRLSIARTIIEQASYLVTTPAYVFSGCSACTLSLHFRSRRGHFRSTWARQRRSPGTKRVSRTGSSLFLKGCSSFSPELIAPGIHRAATDPQALAGVLCAWHAQSCSARL